MNEEELVSYVVRYCKHELSEEEYRFLQRWLEEKQENRQTFREWVRTYRQGRKVGCWDGIQEEQAWEQISCRLSASPRKRRRLWKEWWKQVAILILLLGSGLLYYSLQQLQESRETALSQIVPGSRKAVLRLSDGREVTLEKETTCVLTEEDGTRISVGGQEHIVYQAVSQEQEKLAYNTITVPRGGEYSLVLSDGTRVWLNAETELTYPTVFGKGERKLMLKGEACFEVVTDTARPFIVESFYNRVEVLGTRFNVSAYTGKSAVKTTLLRGKVKVSNRKGQLVLSPGEQAVCLEEEIEKCEVDARAVAAWGDGTFEFENMSLGEITDQLGRWYDVDFVFADPQLKAITFTGAATRYRELDFVWRMLEELARVRFQLENKTIRVSKI